MATSWQLNSVGIDIGTTTSQVIFSRLEVVNRASVSQVPSYEFSKRDIIFVSPIIKTPIDFEGHVREAELKAFIEAQYQAAGIEPKSINSGAIIITGESSKAKNARATIMQLAETLGDFIVATAGPHLESVIAGYGSGAADYAKSHNARVLNIDIGGGTSNYVVFEAGRIVDTACLNVGGHLIEFDTSGKIKNLHKPAQIIAEALLGSIDFKSIEINQITRIVQQMAQLVYEVIIGKPSELAQQLLMTECLKSGQQYDAVFISGGVGQCFYEPIQQTAFEKYGDIGPLLAKCLHENIHIMALPLRTPKHTVRATVIGAGAYTLSLSGSTIWIDPQKLPVRNIPVIHASGDSSDIKMLSAVWQLSSKRMDIDLNQDLYALCIPDWVPVRYQAVLECVTAIQSFIAECPNNPHPLFIVCLQDMGKVLGMLLHAEITDRALAIIDEVQTHLGDYIDIGLPFQGGEVLPITIKSLAFPS